MGKSSSSIAVHNGMDPYVYGWNRHIKQQEYSRVSPIQDKYNSETVWDVAHIEQTELAETLSALGSDVHVVMEYTESYYESIAQFLHRAVFCLCQIRPWQLKGLATIHPYGHDSLSSQDSDPLVQAGLPELHVLLQHPRCAFRTEFPGIHVPFAPPVHGCSSEGHALVCRPLTTAQLRRRDLLRISQAQCSLLYLTDRANCATTFL